MGGCPALAAAFNIWDKTGNSSSSGRTGLWCYNHLLRIFSAPGSGPSFCIPRMCYKMGKTHEANVMTCVSAEVCKGGVSNPERLPGGGDA